MTKPSGGIELELNYYLYFDTQVTSESFHLPEL